MTPLDDADVAAVGAQLGRAPRGLSAVAHRCPCGLPDVVRTLPRLPDGTPFPTLFYLTCPRATSAVSTLEVTGMMRDMERRLAEDPALAAAYASAHESYLAERATLGDVPEIEGISAGGMPSRVKCLHVLVAHALAAGPGRQPARGRGAGGAAGVVVLGSLRGAGMTRVAAIDCGTNAIRLLVADVDASAGTLVDLDRRMEVVRLGEGVDRTGRLAPGGAGAHVRRVRGVCGPDHRARGGSGALRRDLRVP